MSFTYKTRDDSHAYYNVNIYNNDPVNFTNDATFFEERTDPIIENADEFHLSVIRLNIPMLQQPILQIPTNYFSIYLYNPVSNTISRKYLVWQTESSYEPVNYPYMYIYSYENLVNIVNNAIQAAFTALAGPYPAGITKAPFFTYNAETQKFGFYAENGWDIRANPGTMRLFFSPNLYNLFGFFPSIYNYGPTVGVPFNFNAYLILLSAYDYNVLAPNPNTYFTTYQEISALYLINIVRKIILFANGIPIKTEEIAAIDGNGQPNNQPILTDFTPILDSNNPNARFDINYIPTAEYKLSDLISNNSLRKLGFSLFWQDEDNVLHPIRIPPNKGISIKLLFRKIRENNSSK